LGLKGLVVFVVVVLFLFAPILHVYCGLPFQYYMNSLPLSPRIFSINTLFQEFVFLTFLCFC
jgi:hypothetical protein